MSDRITEGLKACISSLETIIGPAVAKSGDSLAREQVGLLAKYLDFVATRFDDLDSAASYELEAYSKMAGEVAAALPDDAGQTLRALVERSASLLGTPGASKVDTEAATAALKTEISRIVREISLLDEKTGERVNEIVVRRSRPLIRFRRSWYAIQGWEADESALPDIHDLMREGTRA